MAVYAEKVEYGGNVILNASGGLLDSNEDPSINSFERKLYGAWTNSGPLVVAGTLTVLGGGNVLTNGHPYTLSDTNSVRDAMAPVLSTNVSADTAKLGGIAAATWSNKVFAVTTNFYSFSFSSVATNLPCWFGGINEGQTVTQFVSRGWAAGAATASVVSAASTTNAPGSYTVIGDLLLTSTQTTANVWGSVAAGGDIGVAITNGWAGLSSGTLSVKSVNQ
jgi:hypothetical protein